MPSLHLLCASVFPVCVVAAAAAVALQKPSRFYPTRKPSKASKPARCGAAPCVILFSVLDIPPSRERWDGRGTDGRSTAEKKRHPQQTRRMRMTMATDAPPSPLLLDHHGSICSVKIAPSLLRSCRSALGDRCVERRNDPPAAPPCTTAVLSRREWLGAVQSGA